MDNQKDFIHIDNLFKQLGNGEEPERSGSWLHMKELLDKEMPLGTTLSAGRSFRRYLIPVLAAVLAVGGGAIYYKLNESDKTPSTRSVAASHPANGGAAAGSDATHRLVAADSRDRVALKDKTPDARRREDAGPGAENRDKTRDKAAGKSVASTRQGNGGTLAASRSTTGRQPEAGAPAQAKTSRGTVDPTAAAHTTAGNRMHNAAATPKKESNKKDTHLAGSETQLKEEQRVIEQIAPVQKNTQATAVSGNEENQARTNTYAAGNTGVRQLPVALGNKKIVKDSEGNLYKEQRDTFKRIDLVERLVASGNRNKGGATYKTTMDTVAVTKVEKVRYVPLDHLELISLRKLGIEASSKKIVPAAGLKERTLSRKEIVSLVPLNQYKVASRRIDPGKFNQLIQNTSQGISNYFDGSHNFYAAVLVGGNASFGNPGAFGMQVGIAGLYSLSERLTLAAELKYVNHYFSNYSIEDRSVTFENISSQQSGTGWLFSGQQNTTTSAYKINGFGALEMPVTLSYNLGRLSIFAGLNMAYAFPIKWSKENTFNTTNVQQTQNQNQNPFRDDVFKVDEQKDFNSRFGVGYLWGMSYDVSRKISLDARVSQIVWDNGSGNTDAINRMFRIPTMQVSIGYFFGRKDKVIYIMDKR